MPVKNRKLVTSDNHKEDKQILLENIEVSIRENQSSQVITWHLLGGENFMLNEPTSAFDFIEAGITGITKKSVTVLASSLNVPMSAMATILNVSVKTLTRKKPDDVLDQLSSSLSIEIAQLVAKGMEVFEDRDKFNRWLQKDNKALKGQKPFDLLNTPTGIRLVSQILGRIEDGVYS